MMTSPCYSSHSAVLVLALCALGSVEGCTPVEKLVTGEADEATTLTARFTEPCGRSMLELPDGELVQPLGDRSPTRRLAYDVLLGTPLRVSGSFVALVDDEHCGAYRGFVVSDFAPAGEVRRVVSIGGLDGDLHRYTADLPTDRFAPSDFEGYRGVVAMIDTDSCVTGSACSPPARAVVDASGTAYCCSIYDLDLREE